MTDLTSQTVNMLLTTLTYAPNTTETGHAALADITNQLAGGNGYTTGGVALSTPLVTAINTPVVGYKFSSGNALWTASGTGIPAWRFAVIYVVGSLWGITSPLLAYFTGDSAPADVPLTASGNSLQLTCPSNGWYTVSRT